MAAPPLAQLVLVALQVLVHALARSGRAHRDGELGEREVALERLGDLHLTLLREGDVLVGTIVGEPGSASSYVSPVFGERRLIDGKIELASGNGFETKDIQLETVDGGFISSIDQSEDVPIGATVRLNESSWPMAAQGMRLARLVSRKQRQSNPARMDLVFEPIADVNDLGRLVIVVEDVMGGE